MPAFPKGTKYQDDDGNIHAIRISAKVLAAAGTQPTGAVDSPIPAKVSKGNREFGLRPRGVRLSRLVGTDPNQFSKYAFVPVLTSAAFNTGNFVPNGTVSYDGNDWTVANLVAEDYK